MDAAASVEDLPVIRERHEKGITVYPNGSSVEIHWGYTVLRPGRVVATPREAVRES